MIFMKRLNFTSYLKNIIFANL